MARGHGRPNNRKRNKMIPMIALTQVTQEAANSFGVLFAIACGCLALIGLLFAVIWSVFPLIVWAKMNEQIKLLKQMAK
jgi:hypothetical protein